MQLPFLRTSSTFDGYFPPGQRQFRWWCWGGAEKHKYVESLWNRSFLWWITTEPSPWGKSTPSTTVMWVIKPVCDRATDHVKSPGQRLWPRQNNDVFVKQVVVLTVNHRGLLPLRELHSTDETIVWRDPGGSWACLPPVYDYGWNHPSRGCESRYLFLWSVTTDPPFEELHSIGEIMTVWGDCGILSLFQIMSKIKLPGAVTLVAQLIPHELIPRQNPEHMLRDS